MKILLLGEFSGFFSNLKKGFQALGHDVTLISAGDGWKKIPGSDITFPSHKNTLVRRVLLFISMIYYSNKMTGYDVVLIINPGFFKVGLTKLLLNKVRKNNKKVFLSACGDDHEYITFGNNNGFDYWPYSADSSGKYENIPTPNKDIHHMVARSVDGIIPIFYDYALAWRNSSYENKVKQTIPLPISDFVDNVVCTEAKKLRIIHGLNRPHFKGGDFIVKALNRLKEKYPEQVEVNVFEPVELAKYKEILKNSDVVIDQCKFMSGPAMNALYSLSQGKVVLAGQTAESLNEYNIAHSPIVSITPDVDNIFSQLENLVLNKDKIKSRATDSLNFTKQHNHTNVIAEQYIKVFKC